MAKRVTTEQRAKVTAQMMKAVLLRRFEPPEWWAETEVTLHQRRLDVVAVQLWGGRRLVGIEVKVTRGDWMAERKQWRKHDEWAAVVDHFYIAAPKGVVQVDELPVGWGLLELVGTGEGMLRVKVQPHGTPGDGVIPRELVARFLMRAEKQVTAMKHRLDGERTRARLEMREEVEAQMQAQWAERQARLHDSAIVDAEKWRRLMHAVGSESWWDEAKVRTAVALLKGHHGLSAVEGAQQRLTQAAEEMVRLRGQLEDAAAVMRSAQAQVQALLPTTQEA